MFDKKSQSIPKWFSFRKINSVSLKSLNLYYKDSEKLNDETKLYNNKTDRLKKHLTINNKSEIKLNRAGIKQRYFNLFKNHLSPNNLFIKKNSNNLGQKNSNSCTNLCESNNNILENIKDNKFLFKLKLENNISRKLKKSNSCLNIKDFSKINYSKLNDKTTTISSKRKTFFNDKNKKCKNIIDSYKPKGKIIRKLFNNNFNINQNNRINNILLNKRKKYPFIYNSETIKIQELKDLPESIINNNKTLCMKLNKENFNLFSHSFNIIKKGKFSQKFEIPWNYLAKFHIISEKKLNENRKEISYGKEIIKELNQILELNKCKYRNYQTQKDDIFSKFRKKMKEILLIYKNLIIPLSEIINTYKITNHIFNFEQTRELISAIKGNNYSLSYKILTHYKYIVLDVDQFYFTPLHYAAKYNFYKLIPLIIGYGGYVDAKNSFGETPVMICIKKNYYESILLLFLYFSSPFIYFINGKKLKDISKDFKTNFICEKIKKIYINNILFKQKNFYNSIKNDITDFIVNECQRYIQFDCIELIQNQSDFINL